MTSRLTSLSAPAVLAPGAFRYVSKMVFIAAEFSGVPSWNCTFGRSVTVHSVKSVLGSTDSARYGWISPFSSRRTSGS
jgi:hypothetical protein